MKKVKKSFLKTGNLIITSVLALLGFTSCDAVMEYGTPHAKFIVNGKVVSSETQKPVGNILVTMRPDYSQGEQQVYTDKSGNYLIECTEFPIDQVFDIVFKDIDGAENEDLENLETTVEFKDPEFTGKKKNWYEGETRKTLDVQLNPKAK